MERAKGSVETRVVTANAAETKRLGRCIGKLLIPGDLIFLSGSFGAGKTTLTQGIARGLGIHEQVTSPSFTLVNQYRGPNPKAGAALYHIDLFRLTNPTEVLGLGLDEYVTEQTICIIEWPDQASDLLPHERLVIQLAFLGRTGRTLTFAGYGLRYAQLVEAIATQCAPSLLAEGKQ